MKAPFICLFFCRFDRFHFMSYNLTTMQFFTELGSAYQSARSGEFTQGKEQFLVLVNQLRTQAYYKGLAYLVKRHEDKEGCPEWFKKEGHPTNRPTFGLVAPVRESSYIAKRIVWLKLGDFISWTKAHPELGALSCLVLAYFLYSRPIVTPLALTAFAIYQILD